MYVCVYVCMCVYDVFVNIFLLCMYMFHENSFFRFTVQIYTSLYTMYSLEITAFLYLPK